MLIFFLLTLVLLKSEEECLQVIILYCSQLLQIYTFRGVMFRMSISKAKKLK